MSLLIWLPLTEDRHNQGLLQLPEPIYATTYGTMTTTNGAIGLAKNDYLCYHFDESILRNEWTISSFIIANSAYPESSNNIVAYFGGAPIGGSAT